LGRRWYEAGKALNKKNTFSDFVACAKWLVDENWTNPEMMCAKAASAGGLLLAHIANEHPQLFKAMILKVPFVDVLTSMLDTTLPLTVHEFDEWGDPASDKQVFDYMLSYDPYRNIKRQDYPHMLLTASTLDIRVPGWQPLKYIAKLRKFRTDNNMLFISVDSAAGHFGAGGRNGLSREAATDFAFLYQALGYRPKHLPIHKEDPVTLKIER
jgi:oligopeptidase B